MKITRLFLFISLINNMAMSMEHADKKQKTEEKDMVEFEVPSLVDLCIPKVAQLPRNEQGLYKKGLPQELDERVAREIMPDHPLYQHCAQEVLKAIQKSKNKKASFLIHDNLVAALNHQHNKIAFATIDPNEAFPKIFISDLDNDDQLKTLFAFRNITELTFNADATKLISRERNDIVRLWDVNSGQCLRQLTQHNNDDYFAMAINPAGTIVATAAVREGEDTSVFEISLWDAGSGGCIKKLMGHTNAVFELIFSRDGKLLASGSQDGTVRIWDIATGECINIPDSLEEDEGHCIALNHNGTKLIAVDSRIYLYDVKTGKNLYFWSRCMPKTTRQTSSTCTINFNHDGTLFLSKEWDRYIRVFEVATGKCLMTLESPDQKIYLAEFNSDGTQIIGVQEDGYVYSWNIQPLHELRSLVQSATLDMIKLLDKIETKKSNPYTLNDQEKEILFNIYKKSLDEQLAAMAQFMERRSKYQLNAEEIKLFLQLPDSIQTILEPFVQFVDKDLKIKENKTEAID